ncbi:MAG: hypothetical protein AUJ92_19885 [Armatimonadetes bacterium CG2_30_59_28]|nr:YfhO family protein [Armatimonadota bacterium]OIO90073.1 MAG: hypothetical protein AUJ92_19885 [Armatimonadetes bacterium CG2_30_59_28]PIU60536.1 MAG: hypothetical protein COS85_24185 [Armatimonadetes bacterium CG07_land_8_20_14_0_80_59_28]PIX42456.1 MAG: hypothetical protein COZ56_09315 [Armatimonadetes bacterium CG_4_8_14_3_um_filter_58_9]
MRQHAPIKAPRIFSSLPGWPRDAVCCFLLIVLSVIFLHKVVFLGKVLLPADLLLLMPPWKSHAAEMFPDFHRVYNPMLDVIQQYYPWRLFSSTWIREGVLPLWNPHMFSGTSFVANGQSAIFYPLNLLFCLMPVKLAFGWTAVMHLALIGVSTYGFLRCILARRVAALTGAVAFMFCGFISAWLEFTTFLCTATWLPISLYIFERTVCRHSSVASDPTPPSRFYVGMSLTGLSLGMALLAGHLQIGLYVWLTFGAYAAYRMISVGSVIPGRSQERARTPTRPHSPGRFLSRVVLAVMIGLFVGAPQWLPVMELTHFSTRAGEFRLESIWGARLTVTHLLTFLVPNFFGNPVDYNYWGSFNFIELSGSIGVVALLLWVPALVALFRRKADRCESPDSHQQTGFWLALLLVSMSIAMLTPLYYVFVHCIPGFAQLRGPARALLMIDFSGAVLAAHGVEALLRRVDGESRRALHRATLIVAGLLTGVMMVGVLFLAQEYLSDFFFSYGMRQLAVFAWFLVVGVLLMRRVSQRPSNNGNAYQLPSLGSPAMLAYFLPVLVAVELFVADMRFNPQLDAEMVYFDTPSTRYLQEDPSMFRVLGIGTSFLNWLPSNTLMSLGLEEIQGSDSLWTRNYAGYLNDVQPGAPTFGWNSQLSPRLDDLNVKYVLAPPNMGLEPPPGELILDGDLRIYRRPHPKPRCYVDDGRALEYHWLNPNHLRVQIGEGSAGDTALHWSNACYPGWQVWVDGQRGNLRSRSEVVQTAVLPAGSDRADIVFYPTSVKLGIFLMCLAAGMVSASLARGWRGRLSSITQQSIARSTSRRRMVSATER